MNEVNASGAIGSGSEQKKSKRTHLNPLERKKVKFLFSLKIKVSSFNFRKTKLLRKKRQVYDVY